MPLKIIIDSAISRRTLPESAIVRKQWRHKPGDRAAISLEAALIMPWVIFFVIAFAYLMRAHEAEVLWHAAGAHALEEAKLSYNIVGLADLSQAQGKLMSKLPEPLRQPIRDLMIQGLGRELILLRQKNRFQQYTESRPYLRKILKPGRAHLNVNLSRHQASYRSNYDIELLFYRGEREDCQQLSLWNLKDLSKIADLSGDDAKKKREDTIWSETNFKRGDYFREKYGANLPHNFPVIAAKNGSQVTMIKSIDLTAPTYQTALGIEIHTQDLLTRLRRYQGTGERGYAGYVIRPEDIQSRKLVVIIPENSPEAGRMQLELILSNSGIAYEIFSDEASYRYQREAEGDEPSLEREAA
ncbi:MAG: hypothetical protein Q4P72_01005 [Eubacteriales bacterium]|nr:hypothetical protein [Eubacteriales bacterium]